MVQRVIGTMIPVSSAIGRNRSGAEHALDGVQPAQQRLGANCAAAAQVDDRLEEELQLVALEGDVEIRLQADEARRVSAHARAST